MDCQTAGSADYRVYMFLGVMARDAGNRERAIEFLKKAHDMAPQDDAPPAEARAGHTLASSPFAQVLARLRHREAPVER